MGGREGGREGGTAKDVQRGNLRGSPTSRHALTSRGLGSKRKKKKKNVTSTLFFLCDVPNIRVNKAMPSFVAPARSKRPSCYPPRPFAESSTKFLANSSGDRSTAKRQRYADQAQAVTDEPSGWHTSPRQTPPFRRSPGETFFCPTLPLSQPAEILL